MHHKGQVQVIDNHPRVGLLMAATLCNDPGLIVISQTKAGRRLE